MEAITPFMTVISNIRIPASEEGGQDTGLVLSVYKCQVPDTETAHITINNMEHTTYLWCDKAQAAQLLQVKYPTEFTHALEHTH